VYKVAKQWEGLPSADEMAAVQRREKRLREKRRVQRQAAAAGAPVPQQQPQQQQQQQLSALSPESAAAAAAAAAAGESDDDEEDEPIEVVAELNVDQVGVLWTHWLQFRTLLVGDAELLVHFTPLPGVLSTLP
jgi:hypothetical protein